MACNTSVPIVLTSTAIPATETGYYTFDQISFLFPHEPIRRELTRGREALRNLDLQNHSWKLKYVNKWLNDFLIPVIADHHDAEDKYLFPAYTALGVKIPTHIEKGHEKLDEILALLTKLSCEVYNAVNENKKNEYEAKFAELKTVYEDFYVNFNQHLHDEEEFWPAVIREQGEENYTRINADLHAQTKAQKTAKLFICSVLDSMGYEFDLNTPTHNVGKWKDTRWCNEDLLNDKIVNKIPYFVRAYIFPSMNRRYQYFKKMVMVIAYEDEDSIPMEYVDESSWCVIS